MPHFSVTPDIAAPPERVWPWRVQMGAGRAGWYSYDRIDNGGRPSADRIVPELQRLAVGDVMPAVPGAVCQKLLSLQAKPGTATNDPVGAPAAFRRR